VDPHQLSCLAIVNFNLLLIGHQDLEVIGVDICPKRASVSLQLVLMDGFLSSSGILINAKCVELDEVLSIDPDNVITQS
jgi:hypothetical protein